MIVDGQMGLNFVSGSRGVFTEIALVKEVVEVKDLFHEVAHNTETIGISIGDEATC